MIIKMKAELAGGHYHIGVWMGKREGALGKCGTLVMRDDEWDIFATALMCASHPKECLTGKNEDIQITQCFLQNAAGRELAIIIEEKIDDEAAE